MPELWLRAVPLSPNLGERLRALTGDGVVDCGLEVNPLFVRPGFSPYYLHEAFACAEGARASRWPFQLLFQQVAVRRSWWGWSERPPER